MSQQNQQGHRQIAPKTNGQPLATVPTTYVINQSNGQQRVVYNQPSSRGYQPVTMMQAVHSYPQQIVVNGPISYGHNVQPIQVTDRGRLVHHLPQPQQLVNEPQYDVILDDDDEDPSDMPPKLHQMNVEISEQEDIRPETDLDSIQRLMFMEEAARFRKIQAEWDNNVIQNEFDGFIIEESDSPIKSYKKPKPVGMAGIAAGELELMESAMDFESDEVEEDRDDDFVLEAPAPRGRGRGRGRGGRGRGRGGRGRGGRRSWARDRDEDSGNDESFERESPEREEVEAPNPAPEKEAQMKELEDTPESSQEGPHQRRRKRNEVDGLMSFDHGPAWNAGTPGERRRSTLEEREREREKEREANAPKTRQKRRNTTESNATDNTEPPVKKTPEKKEEQVPQNPPSSSKKPAGFCKRCGEPIKVSKLGYGEIAPQYCSKKCRKLQLLSNEDHSEIDDQEVSSESQGPSEYGNPVEQDTTEGREEQGEPILEPVLLPGPAGRSNQEFRIPTSSEFSAKRIRAIRLGSSSETPGEVSSPGSNTSGEGVSPTDESPRAMVIPKKEDDERRSSSEPVSEEPSDETWSPEYSAEVIATILHMYPQKEELKKRVIDLELDGYFLAHFSMDKNTLKNLFCTSMGPAVTLSRALQRRQPKHKELSDSFKADPATIQTVEETAQWIKNITNDECAAFVLENELDLVSLSFSKHDELVDLGMKYGKAYKITHILEENRKAGVVFEIPELPESFMNEKLHWTENHLSKLLQQYIPEKNVEIMMKEGISVNLMYNMDKEDFYPELGLPFGPAKIMAKMMQNARDAGGKPADDFSKIADNVSAAPANQNEVNTWLLVHVQKGGLATEAEKQAIKNAQIDPDMFFHLTLDSLMQNLGLRYAVAKIITVRVNAAKARGWGPSPASDPLCEDFLKKTRHWSVDDTADWMRSYCSEKVAEKMREAGIDGEALPYLTINGLMEFLNLSYNDALKIMTKFKHIKAVLDSEEPTTPLPEGEITTKILFDWLKQKISAEAVEKLAENGMQASFFSIVTMKDLVGKMGLRFIDALKLIETVSKLSLPSCIIPVDTDITVLDREKTKEWLKPIVGEEEAMKLYNEDYMGETLNGYSVVEDLAQDTELKYGSALAILANVDAARKDRSSLFNHD